MRIAFVLLVHLIVTIAKLMGPGGARGVIGSIRREYFDQVLFWNAMDLESKLRRYQAYFNEQRAHAGIDALTPAVKSGEAPTYPTRQSRRLSMAATLRRSFSAAGGGVTAVSPWTGAMSIRTLRVTEDVFLEPEPR